MTSYGLASAAAFTTVKSAETVREAANEARTENPSNHVCILLYFLFDLP